MFAEQFFHSGLYIPTFQLKPSQNLNLAMVKIPDVRNKIQATGKRFLQEWLTKTESNVLVSLKTIQRQHEWLAGRIAAKVALLQCRKVGRPVHVEVRKMTDGDKMGQPYAFDMTTKRCIGGLSITHSGQYAVAVAAEGTAVGVDLEECRPRHPCLRAKILTSDWECLATDLSGKAEGRRQKAEGNSGSCPLPVTSGNKGLRPRLNSVQSLRLGGV